MQLANRYLHIQYPWRPVAVNDKARSTAKMIRVFEVLVPGGGLLVGLTGEDLLALRVDPYAYHDPQALREAYTAAGHINGWHYRVSKIDDECITLEAC